VRRTVIALTLLVFLGIASQANAAAPRPFYGVIPASDPDSTEIARMGTGKVGTLRINFVWGAVQPTAGAPYDWSHYDAIIGAAAQQGIRVLPTVYSSPAWAARKSNYPPSKAHMNDFRAFVTAAAQRYGANGTFWRDNPTIPKLPVIDWQLWNEVNSPSFWYRKPSVKQYVGLLHVFHDGIKAGDPSALIVLAGLFRTPQLKNAIDLDHYLPGIYRRKAKRLFDAVAVHPYATTPHDALEAVKETRKIMNRFKDRHTPIWITEMGWATGGNPPTALTVSPQRQATYLRKGFGLMAANRGRLGIAGVICTRGGTCRARSGSSTPACSPRTSTRSRPGTRSSA
jgi:hypothetical protein